MTRLVGDLLQFDLKTEENPHGVYELESLYSDLLDVRIWGFANDDPARAWNRRRKAQESAKRILESTEAYLRKATGSGPIHSLIGAVTNGLQPNNDKDSLRSFGRETAAQLIESGKSIEETAEIMLFTALGGIGAALTTVGPN